MKTKPDSMTKDSIVLFDAMCDLCAKITIYEADAVTTALEWFIADAKGDPELEILVQPMMDLIAANRLAS